MADEQRVALTYFLHLNLTIRPYGSVNTFKIDIIKLTLWKICKNMFVNYVNH